MRPQLDGDVAVADDVQVRMVGLVLGKRRDSIEEFHGCHEVLHDMGSPRVSASLRVGTRRDRTQSIDDKIDSVKRVMGKNQDH